jgi:outer membrane biosynthesis protein TonB
LARFVHGGDEKLQEKIAYSFSCDLSHPDSSMMVKNVPVSPEVPVYLVYYTIFAVPGTNEVVELNDIYGYDKLLVKSLSSLVSPSMRKSMKDKPQTNTTEKKETKSQPTVVKSEEKKEPKVEKQETPRPAPQEEQKSSDNKSNNAATERDGGSQTAI